MITNKKIGLIIIVTLVVAGGLFLISRRPSSVNKENEQKVSENNKVLEKNQVCLKGKCFEVELAITAQQQAQGLMYRKELDTDKGMFFIFNQSGKRGFWMKNTLIPLDIIWINQEQEIVFISRNTQPCPVGTSCSVFAPDQEALYVLEVNAGWANQLGLSKDVKVFFNIN